MDSEDSLIELKKIHAEISEKYPDMKPICDMYDVILAQAVLERNENDGKISYPTMVIIKNVEKMFQDCLLAAELVELIQKGDIEQVLSEAGIDLSAMMGEDEPVTKDDSGENKVIPFPKNKLH